MMNERAVVVTILGHVDHGKTSLLDFIRKSSVALGEHGGITQSIGAYQIEHEGKKLTFIDTPGHAAFEKMRSRGASVADIAVLVVAADDGVMPQTVEAIKHILASGATMVVAVNKIDLPGLNVEVAMQKIKKQLADNGVLVEGYGGDVVVVGVSAKTGEGVDKLLEMILLVGEMKEVKADFDALVEGVVIEAKMDKFKGPVATILVRNGTLVKGEKILVGGVEGRVRAMADYAGKAIDRAVAGTPVEVVGLEKVPEVGSLVGEQKKVSDQELTVKSLTDRLKEGEVKTLAVVVKADSQGSLEAIEDSLAQFNLDGEHVSIISSGVGEIGEKDIDLASAVRAIVVGFNVKISPGVMRQAETEHVLVRTYSIIYELLDEIKDVIDGMLKVDQLEEIFGTAKILAEFPYGRDERIAGCRVLEGHISKGPRLRVVREVGSGGEAEVVGEAKIGSLKKGKDEISKAESGSECGIIFSPPIEFKVGDLVQSFRVI